MKKAIEAQTKVARALYRDLYRWSRLASDIPFFLVANHQQQQQHSSLPPQTFQHPIISKEHLLKLANLGHDGECKDFEVLRNMLPAGCSVDENKLVVPKIEDGSSLLSLVRVLTRLSSMDESYDQDVVRQRIGLAMEAIKSLNELTPTLMEMERIRSKRLDNSFVRFRVGQVVQHAHEKWRGVVCGWEKKKIMNAIVVTYFVLPDKGDVHHLHKPAGVIFDKAMEVQFQNTSAAKGGKTESKRHIASVAEEDLVLVSNSCLSRIRNDWMDTNFERFDIASMRFIPNSKLAYEYPADTENSSKVISEHKMFDDDADLARTVTLGVAVIANELHFELIASSTEAARKMEPLKSILDRLVKLMPSCRPTTSCNEMATCIRTISNLSKLITKVSDLLFQRRIALINKSRIKFRLGDIVRHKKYGFRGMVVSFDPRPTVDVSRWDGLQHLKNVDDTPFYSIVPDPADTVKAFGAVRTMRYVCEANLEVCPVEDADIDLDIMEMVPGWSFDDSLQRYVPSDEVKFEYGEVIEEENIMMRSMELLEEGLTRALVQMQEESSENRTGLNTGQLLKLLQIARRKEDAAVIEDFMKEVWKSHQDTTIRSKHDDALRYLLSNRSKDALSIFTNITLEEPHYGEAWNKKATCHFMHAELEEAIEAIQKALVLLPNHYLALGGLGLAYQERMDNENAVKYYQKCLELNPWSPVASRMVACQDTIESDDEDEAVIEGSAPIPDN
mmetsp:Transcript_491/g.837  ORF Transcript_491/g.837 Transcript_491/m.837 type:complete len:730 (-) Transcript_491:345-2534(-)